ncbi:FAD synthetase family protein [Psychrobacillus soli]|uniref:FAD synthase n=1 Tax=Psychrobacillus soli TaxID=1543965 RepID=A0A544STM9_9BACI|nr:FAD synthetase family protein [Psychrobacillus soli]TQR08570.1 FAD synthetase family protein [Psychrobacillus soli]
METIYLNATNLGYWKNKSTSNVIALGFFDGIHKGHQKVIRTAVKKAKEKSLPVTVMSFFPHPKVVLSNGKKKFDYIMPLTEKGKVLESLGVDIFYIVEFDKRFASLSPEEYVANYLLDFGVVHAVAGYDFTYGKFGAGHIDRMVEDGKDMLEVTKVGKVEFQGEKISSTSIREMLATGSIENFPHILGRSYELECKWNGNSFEPLPYYTMPESGCYSVTIHKNNKLFQVNVNVSDDRNTIYFKDYKNSEFSNGEKVTITWHNRIENEVVYFYSS